MKRRKGKKRVRGKKKRGYIHGKRRGRERRRGREEVRQGSEVEENRKEECMQGDKLVVDRYLVQVKRSSNEGGASEPTQVHIAGCTRTRAAGRGSDK